MPPDQLAQQFLFFGLGFAQIGLGRWAADRAASRSRPTPPAHSDTPPVRHGKAIRRRDDAAVKRAAADSWRALWTFRGAFDTRRRLIVQKMLAEPAVPEGAARVLAALMRQYQEADNSTTLADARKLYADTRNFYGSTFARRLYEGTFARREDAIEGYVIYAAQKHVRDFVREHQAAFDDPEQVVEDMLFQTGLDRSVDLAGNAPRYTGEEWNNYKSTVLGAVGKARVLHADPTSEQAQIDLARVLNDPDVAALLTDNSHFATVFFDALGGDLSRVIDRYLEFHSDGESEFRGPLSIFGNSEFANTKVGERILLELMALHAQGRIKFQYRQRGPAAWWDWDRLYVNLQYSSIKHVAFGFQGEVARQNTIALLLEHEGHHAVRQHDRGPIRNTQTEERLVFKTGLEFYKELRRNGGHVDPVLKDWLEGMLTALETGAGAFEEYIRTDTPYAFLPEFESGKTDGSPPAFSRMSGPPDPDPAMDILETPPAGPDRARAEEPAAASLDVPQQTLILGSLERELQDFHTVVRELAQREIRGAERLVLAASQDYQGASEADRLQMVEAMIRALALQGTRSSWDALMSFNDVLEDPRVVKLLNQNPLFATAFFGTADVFVPGAMSDHNQRFVLLSYDGAHGIVQRIAGGAPDPDPGSNVIFRRLPENPIGLPPPKDPLQVVAKGLTTLLIHLRAATVPTLERWHKTYELSMTDYEASQLAREIVSLMPTLGRLAELLADIHSHPRPYDRRIADQIKTVPDKIRHPIDGRLFGDFYRALVDKIGKYGLILAGNIPQSEDGCGVIHYSDVKTWLLTLKGAHRLDKALAQSFLRLYRKLPDKAAQMDASLTGFQLTAEDAVRYIRGRLLEFPGVFKFLGELTLHKEMVTALLRDEATTLTDRQLLADIAEAKQTIKLLETGLDTKALRSLTNTQKVRSQIRQLQRQIDEKQKSVDASKRALENFKAVLGLAEKTGLGVLIHCDWGKVSAGPDGRPQETICDYSNFDELLKLVEPYKKANIILAHTGLGRFVRPDDTPVTAAWKRPDGSVFELEAPRHIVMMEEMLAANPHVKFDISWNDVGEAYVTNPKLRQGLVDFILRHPDAVLWGSDTVKPVNKPHYNQAFVTALPLLADVARVDSEAAWNLLRGNYVSIMTEAGRDVADWTRGELLGAVPASLRQEFEAASKAGNTDQFSGHKTLDKVITMEKMLNDLAVRRAGNTTKARELFDEIIGEFRSQDPQVPGNPMVEPETIAGPPNRGKAASRDSALLGPSRSPRSDSPDTPAPALPGGHPPSPRELASALARALARLGVATAAGVGLAHAPISLTGLTTAATVLRQIAFFSRTAYREYVRVSWERLFEDRDVSDKTINVFLNRVLLVGGAVGIDGGDLKAVVRLTGEFRADVRFVFNASPSLTKEQLDNALMGIIGLYQIRVDRQLGASASSLEATNSLTRIGQLLHLIISTTAVVNAAGGVHDLATGDQSLAQTVQEEAYGASQVGMAAASGAASAGRRAGVSLDDHRLVRLVQMVYLALLTVGGAAGTVRDAALLSSTHGMASLVKTLVDSVITGSGIWVTGNDVVRLSRIGSPAGRSVAAPVLIITLAIALRAILQALVPDEQAKQPHSGQPPAPTPPAPTPTPSLSPTPSPPTSPTPGSGPAPPPGAPPGPSQQFAVVPQDGVNVRAAPSINAAQLGAFYQDTYVEATGRVRTDSTGRSWAEVSGTDAAGNQVQGWVAAEYLTPHPAGSMNGVGRVDPNLEQQGYQSETVQPGDTASDLAQKWNVDLGAVAAVNADHIIDLNRIRPGDALYRPGTGRPPPPASPAGLRLTA
jgi:SH3 domain-containing protein/LysM domain-containing protein